MPQVCYGVGEIPEDNFYCSACTHVRSLPRNKTTRAPHAGSVKTICCPVLHGGLKPTPFGDWIHLACAVWLPNGGTLKDLQKMEPVDVNQTAKGKLSVGSAAGPSKRKSSPATAPATTTATSLPFGLGSAVSTGGATTTGTAYMTGTSCAMSMAPAATVATVVPSAVPAFMNTNTNATMNTSTSDLTDVYFQQNTNHEHAQNS